jgi:hypothetical protein
MEEIYYEYLNFLSKDFIKIESFHKIKFFTLENPLVIEFDKKKKILWICWDFKQGFFSFFDLDWDDGNEILFKWVQTYMVQGDINSFDHLPL